MTKTVLSTCGKRRNQRGIFGVSAYLCLSTLVYFFIMSIFRFDDYATLTLQAHWPFAYRIVLCVCVSKDRWSARCGMQSVAEAASVTRRFVRCKLSCERSAGILHDVTAELISYQISSHREHAPFIAAWHAEWQMAALQFRIKISSNLVPRSCKILLYPSISYCEALSESDLDAYISGKLIRSWQS